MASSLELAVARNHSGYFCFEFESWELTKGDMLGWLLVRSGKGRKPCWRDGNGQARYQVFGTAERNLSKTAGVLRACVLCT